MSDLRKEIYVALLAAAQPNSHPESWKRICVDAFDRATAATSIFMDGGNVDPTAPAPTDETIEGPDGPRFCFECGARGYHREGCKVRR